MSESPWQLIQPLDAIVFDCDGTLSAIEGIDELAKKNGVSDQISKMTQEAMSRTGLNPQLYQERLNLVYPTKQQVAELGQQYFLNRVPDIQATIQLLQSLGKSIYLVSAGVFPAVKVFAELLGIPAAHVFAVQIEFDDLGNYLDHERSSPLIHNSGKRYIVDQLHQRHKHIAHVGDGLNDLVTFDLVERFIGYGGVFYRNNIAERCHYYINTPSMAALLPLTITPVEINLLSEEYLRLYQKGLTYIQNGEVIVNIPQAAIVD